MLSTRQLYSPPALAALVDSTTGRATPTTAYRSYYPKVLKNPKEVAYDERRRLATDSVSKWARGQWNLMQDGAMQLYEHQRFEAQEPLPDNALEKGLGFPCPRELWTELAR